MLLLLFELLDCLPETVHFLLLSQRALSSEPRSQRCQTYDAAIRKPVCAAAAGWRFLVGAAQTVLRRLHGSGFGVRFRFTPPHRWPAWEAVVQNQESL